MNTKSANQFDGTLQARNQIRRCWDSATAKTRREVAVAKQRLLARLLDIHRYESQTSQLRGSRI
jgi:hypothetical protein